MCNPSPQGRCQGDAAKVVASKNTAFEKTFDDFTEKVGEEKAADIVSHFSTSDKDFSRNSQEVCNALRAVNEAKAFLYATPAAQKNPADAAKKIAELESKLSPLQRQILKETDESSRRSGKFLSKFQEIARKNAKNHPDEPSIATARVMADLGFFQAKHQMEAKLEQAHKESVARAMEVTPGPEQAAVRDKLLRKNIDDHRALINAFEYARADAKETIRKDIAKNSIKHEDTSEKRKWYFSKREDGTFMVGNIFEVKARNLEEATAKAEESYDLGSVRYNVSKTDHDTYTAYTSYNYQGSESLEDVKKFHAKVWKGTPEARHRQHQEEMS